MGTHEPPRRGPSVVLWDGAAAAGRSQCGCGSCGGCGLQPVGGGGQECGPASGGMPPGNCPLGCRAWSVLAFVAWLSGRMRMVWPQVRARKSFPAAGVEDLWLRKQHRVIRHDSYEVFGRMFVISRCVCGCVRTEARAIGMRVCYWVVGRSRRVRVARCNADVGWSRSWALTGL